jgi:hypothetical protein
MSKSEFRATSPQDAAAVTAFLRRIFDMSPDSSVIEPRHLHWKNWEEREDWPGSRGYVMTNQNEIVAHGTVVPLAGRSGDRQFRVVHLIDWAAEAKSVGSGVALLKSIGRLADTIMVAGGSEMTQKILPALGFKSCGEVRRFARPLRPFKRLTGQPFSWRLGAQFGRSALWNWQAPSARLSNWDTRRILPEEIHSSSIPWPQHYNGGTVMGRTSKEIAYYLRCPATPMELYAVQKDGLTRGYFLLSFAPAQARIADVWMESADASDWQALIQLAVRKAESNKGVAEVVSLAGDPVTIRALIESGFHDRGGSPLRLLACGKKELPDQPVCFRMLDSDAAYLHGKTPEFWA